MRGAVIGLMIGAGLMMIELSFADSGRHQPAVEASLSQRIDSFTNSVGMAFRYIPPGSFFMGSPPGEGGRDADETLHHVTLSRGFFMQTTEVSQRQWRMIMENNPANFNYLSDDFPVEQVSWNQVQDFIGKLNRLEKTDAYRLPTEAEWEYACRAGSDAARFWGDNPDDGCGFANVHDQTSKQAKGFSWLHHRCEDGFDIASPVGSLSPNGFGLYDMLGNVWEWTLDFKGKYATDPAIDPQGPSGGGLHVVRGGSWDDGPKLTRCANRDYDEPNYTSYYIGFRLVRELR